MINRADADTKAILGPEMTRTYVCPTIPNGEAMKCGTCGRVAQLGHPVIHSVGCSWAAMERERLEKWEPLGGGDSAGEGHNG